MGYTTYKIRWLLLITDCSVIFMRNIVSKSFGVINNVVADYFDVDPSQVDFFSTVNNVSAVIFGFILLMLSGRFTLRTMMLIKAFFMFLSVVSCTIGFLSKDFYWIVLTGIAVMGITEALIFVIPAVLAANWFPQNELAIAFNISTAVSFGSSALAGILFPFLFTGNHSIALPGSIALFGPGENLAVEPGNLSIIAKVKDDTKIKLVSIFGGASVLTLVAFILALLVFKDNPATPPSASQETILELQKINADDKRGSLNFRYLCDEVKELFRIPQFVLIVSANFCRGSTASIPILGPSFILQTFPELDNRIPGLVLAVSSLGAALGAIIAGRILDKYKRPKILTTISTLLNIFAAFAMYFGHLYKQLVLICIAYIMGLFFDCMIFLAASEFLLETTYPRKKLVLSIFYYSSYNLGVFAYIAFDRWLQKETDETWAVFAYIIVNFILLLLYQIAKPEYKRSKVDMVEKNADHAESNDESRYLLPPKERKCD